MKVSRIFVSATVVLASLFLSLSARAGVITFAGANGTILPGNPQTEGDYTYEALSGGLFRSDSRGNPAPGLEGRSDLDGGLASFKRTDDGLFTFDQVDIAQSGFGEARAVVFEGFLGGVSQGSDSLQTAIGTNFFLTRSSVNLAGLAIDELQVELDGQLTPNAWEAMDNLVLSASVPEPSSLVLNIICLGILGFLRRSKLRNCTDLA